ncbi:MAG: AAA family ATPase [Candidatus Pacebacteria bacterium]|nr:AAA family ATPase [Candidatus Paceibacterota bacterium]
MGEHKLKENKPTLPIKEDYESIEINGFRGIKHLKIDNLGKVNLILGKNDSGKTSLLEAISTHAAGHHLAFFLNHIVNGRELVSGLFPEYVVDQLVNIFNVECEPSLRLNIIAKFVNISQKYEHALNFKAANQFSNVIPRYLRESTSTQDFSFVKDKNPMLHLGGQNDPQFAMINATMNQVIGLLQVQSNSIKNDVYLTMPSINMLQGQAIKHSYKPFYFSHLNAYNDGRIFDDLKREDLYQALLDNLNSVFDPIKSIDYFRYDHNVQGNLYITKQNNTRLPISSFGDGFRKLLFITAQLMFYKNVLICVDEVDINFHHSLQKKFSTLLSRISQTNNNQIFLTTHSVEFIDNFLSALYDDGNEFGFTEANDPVRVITLQRDEKTGQVSVWNRTGADAHYIRSQLAMEIR